MLFPPSNLVLLLTETNTQNHTHALINTRETDLLDSELALVGSDVCLQALHASRIGGGNKNMRERTRGVREMMKDQNKSGQGRASGER